MLKGPPSHMAGTRCHPGASRTATPWFAVALGMLVLAA